MLFPDYMETKKIYHIISITDLDKTLKRGIKYDDKNTYQSKYYQFHDHIDKFRKDNIPDWVVRKRAIFGSLNFTKSHKFHSHTALLSLNIKPEKCWIANENLVNEVYEPFILQSLNEYDRAKRYMQIEGSRMLDNYWDTSTSFNKNLKNRLDKLEGYDAEVLILHNIEPKDIEILYIISDHRMMTKEEWKEHFCTMKES